MANPFEQSLDEGYNPFAMDNGYSTTDTNSMKSSLISDPAPNNDYPSTSSINTQPSGSNPQFKDSFTGLNISESDLAQREAALAKREEMISRREQEINAARANGTLSSLNTHPRNFPILFHFYKYYPEEDLPSSALPFVRKLVLLFYAGGILLALNTLIALFCLAPGPSESIDSAAATICFSIAYTLVCFPLSLELGLFVFYNALKQGKGLKFIGGLVFLALYFAFFVYICVGLGEFGSTGWITSIDIISKAQSNKWVGYIGLIFSILSTLFCVATAFLWYIGFRYFKQNDLQRKAVGEAAGMAAQYAADHREEIIDAARNNPDVAMQAAQFAVNNSGTYT